MLSGCSIVKTVKKGGFKKAKERAAKSERSIRTFMRIDHVCLMIKTLYKRPVSKISPANRRFLLQQLFIFFGMRQ